MSTDPSATTGETPRPAVFRTPLSALVAVVFLALCLSPIAFQGGAWFLLFLLPVTVAWWVLRTQTVVDTEGIRVRTAWRSRHWPWSRVATLRLVDRGWVRAVDASDAGTELALPGVRIHHLGRVGEASGGRIPAPSPDEARAAAEHREELEAARMRVARLREARAAEDDTHDDTGDADTTTTTETGDGTETEGTARNEQDADRA